MPDDMRPRPSAHFTPPWSTVKNIAAKDLDESCIGQRIFLHDINAGGTLVAIDPNHGFIDLYIEGEPGKWMLLPDREVTVFYNFDGETDGNPEYVRGIGVLLLWGVITGLIALAVVVTLWKWS